jgi:hypothetical protein
MHYYQFSRTTRSPVLVQARSLCLNPLDLLKVKFQVSTRGPEGSIGCGIWRALCDIGASEGWRGLYRGWARMLPGMRAAGPLRSIVRLLCLSAARFDSVNLQLQSA